MRTLTRKTTGAVMRVQVDNPKDLDTGGGLFYFASAGDEGDTHQVSDHAAKVIMGDPGQALHFICTPPIETAKPAQAAKKASGPAATEEPDQK
jgi:hypothetical protein